MPNKREGRKDPAYLREQGNREAKAKKLRTLTFSLSKLIDTLEGQGLAEWEELGLLSVMMTRLRFLGQFSCQEALQKKHIKQYTKVDFPPGSEFTQPKHITGVVWTVMHITTTSKEVIAGYIEDDVFYIVFLDKEHLFWPMSNT